MLLKPPLAPMEARSVDEIPTGDGWQYEPKWDGFRCIAFRDAAQIYLQSKNGQPLARYFPDVASALAALPAKQFVVDGERAIYGDNELAVHNELFRRQCSQSTSNIWKIARERLTAL